MDDSMATYREAFAGMGSVVKPLKPSVKVPVVARQLIPWTCWRGCLTTTILFFGGIERIHSLFGTLHGETGFLLFNNGFFYVLWFRNGIVVFQNMGGVTGSGLAWVLREFTPLVCARPALSPRADSLDSQSDTESEKRRTQRSGYLLLPR